MPTHLAHQAGGTSEAPPLLKLFYLEQTCPQLSSQQLSSVKGHTVSILGFVGQEAKAEDFIKEKISLYRLKKIMKFKTVLIGSWL